MLDQREAFYGGAAGGGKSDALLMAALQYVDVPGYAALLLRRTYPELEGSDGLISKSRLWLAPHEKDGVRWNDQKKRWTFPSGAVIQFGHVRNEAEMTRYQGQAYQLVGFDELTHFTESIYDYIGFSRARRDASLVKAGVPVRTRSASNPGGIGHAWVKKRFIDERAPATIFVPAKLNDNPGLDTADYSESLSYLGEDLRRQLLDGDWGAFVGAAFNVTDDHLVRSISLDPNWYRFEGMDYGINNPTCWHAIAVDFDGNLIFFDTYCKPALPSESAPVIRKKRQVWRSSHCWGDPNSLAMRTSTMRGFTQQATIESEFADLGVPIIRGDDNPRAGYTRIRELLKLDPDWRFPDWHARRGEPGSPRAFFVTRTCPELIEQLQTAPLVPIDKRYAGEMVDPTWEGRYGHAIAAARYAVLSRPSPSTAPKQTSPDPRRAFLDQVNEAENERAAQMQRRRYVA